MILRPSEAYPPVLPSPAARPPTSGALAPSTVYECVSLSGSLSFTTRGRSLLKGEAVSLVVKRPKSGAS